MNKVTNRNFVSRALQFLVRQPSMRLIKKHMRAKKPIVLDVGAGNKSVHRLQDAFPGAIYHGIDRIRDYNNSPKEIALIEKFFEMDLTDLRFLEISDNEYDLVNMSHVIEHLYNGDKVIKELAAKVKPAGLIYIEFPGPKSLTLPSMKGCLNFFDDSTHCRIFSVPEVANILLNENFQVVKCGVRRDFIRISLMPIRICYHLLKYRTPLGSDLWDFLGFSEYVLGRKLPPKNL